MMFCQDQFDGDKFDRDRFNINEACSTRQTCVERKGLETQAT